MEEARELRPIGLGRTEKGEKKGLARGVLSCEKKATSNLENLFRDREYTLSNRRIALSA